MLFLSLLILLVHPILSSPAPQGLHDSQEFLNDFGDIFPLNYFDGNANTRPCSNQKTDLFHVNEVFLSPGSPPRRGEYATLAIFGTFQEEIAPDPVVKFLTYDVLRPERPWVNGTFPMCNTFLLDIGDGNGASRNCPPKRGMAEIAYTTYIPPWDGNGNVTLRAEFLTADRRSIFCIEGWEVLAEDEGNIATSYGGSYGK